MEVNAYCGKELFILEVAWVLHTPLLPEKIFRFLLLCCDVEKCMSEIIGLPVLNLASSYSSFVYNNPRSNSKHIGIYTCPKFQLIWRTFDFGTKFVQRNMKEKKIGKININTVTSI